MHPDLAQSTAQALVHCPVSFSIEVGFETRCSADTDIENLAKHISHAHLDHSDRSVDPAFWNDHESLEAGTDAILRDVFHYSDIYPGDSCVDPVLWTNTAGDVTSDTSGSMDTFDRYPATDKPIPDSSNILDVGIRNTILGPAIDEDVPM
ncbi:hypothetical protein CERSUDRAFT_77755 [Gelatoporia subvermispora B]|uniref:Uncharacterized protein n=1 Tax=Ceriporiopsis subvermispora (strain B) TaxID=914234 RepID=M2P913_CERS8|nr:hypothetical protein CERSUDRAFT_77755 [Gelatoporia subvermispora B]